MCQEKKEEDDLPALPTTQRLDRKVWRKTDHSQQKQF